MNVHIYIHIDGYLPVFLFSQSLSLVSPNYVSNSLPSLSLPRTDGVPTIRPNPNRRSVMSRIFAVVPRRTTDRWPKMDSPRRMMALISVLMCAIMLVTSWGLKVDAQEDDLSLARIAELYAQRGTSLAEKPETIKTKTVRVMTSDSIPEREGETERD